MDINPIKAEYAADPDSVPRTADTEVAWTLRVLLAVAVLGGLYLTSLYSYLLFHSLAELFSIVVACGMFFIAWNSRTVLRNNYLLFLGVAYLFIAGFDLIHTLAYEGMGVFPQYGANLAPQLWIAGRIIESACLLIAPVFFDRKLRLEPVFIILSVVTALLMASIFWRVFPVCFIPGEGLTPFKKYSEYVICLVLVGALYQVWRHRVRFEPGVRNLVMWAIVLTIGSELAFTFYVKMYGFSNLVGHYFKIGSFYLMYKAIIETGLRRPFALLFRELRKERDALQDHHKALQVSQEALKERETILNETQELARLGGWELDPEADNLVWTNEIYRILEVPPDYKPTVEDAIRFCDPDDAPVLQEALNALIETGQDYDLELRMTTAKGNRLWTRSIGRAVAADGKIVKITGSLQDITDRKRAEIELEDERERLYSVLEVMPAFVYLLSEDGAIRYSNSRFVEIFGPVDAQPCYSIVGGLSARCPVCRAHEVFKDGRSRDWELTDLRGRTFMVSASYFGNENNVPLVLAVGVDISERKTAVDRLRESEERFRQLTENIDGVFWLTEQDNPEFVAYVSPALERIWGRAAGEGMRLPGLYADAVLDEDRQLLTDVYEELIDGSNRYSVEYRIRRPDGSIRWIWDNAFHIRDDSGQTTRIAGIAQDITRQKMDQERLEQLVEEIRHFAYIVSHDLRAPLINLKGFTRELEQAVAVIAPAAERGVSQDRQAQVEIEQALKEDLPEALAFIASSVTRMDTLISAVLNLSRMGHRELHYEYLDMNEILSETRKSLAYQINELNIVIDAEPLPSVWADRTAIEQVLGNLLDNAVKYSDPNRPCVIRISGHDFPEETCFTIKDTGKGIESSQVSRIFRVFKRGSEHETPGEGMGLAYVRTLLRRHGGRIWVESEPGVGSAFTFTIAKNLPDNHAVSTETG